MRDWPLVLDMAARAIPFLHWNRDRPYLAGVLNVAARALADPDSDTAAVLLGAARSLVPVMTAPPSPAPAHPPRSDRKPQGIIGELRREATALLDGALGAERRRELRAQGEAMNQDQAVALALDAIERVRDTQ